MWDVKKKAIKNAFGDWDSSYAKLPRWLAIVKMRNPGTKFEWSHRQWAADEIRTPYPQFRRLFFAFEASIEGFKHCRPLLQIDATHLYGKYKGKLMIALSIDANGYVFLVAFAVVETESGETWGWFLRMIREHVTDRDGICLISDRHHSILEAVNVPSNGWCPPRGYHRFCLRHIASNFNTNFKNIPLKNILRRAGRKHQLRKFEECMARFAQLSSDTPQCVAYVSAIPKEQWSLAYDGGVRYGWMNINAIGTYEKTIDY